MTTKEMEKALFRAIKRMSRYVCFEVGVPGELWAKKRVDCLMLEKLNLTWRFYELKLTLSDFNSKHDHTFLGHFNYYVMPESLYEKVADRIPEHIGVYMINSKWGYAVHKKFAKRQELKVNHDELMFCFMQALSREYDKGMRARP